MVPALHRPTIAIPPPANPRARGHELSLPSIGMSLSLVTRLHLLALCRIAVRLAVVVAAQDRLGKDN
ncbi:MAG TPA: hypothetical protein VFU32_05145 [Ktedonobacterales bacterium]|nr:hypothetical protein [Ktedonobacterales bacterium]